MVEFRDESNPNSEVTETPSLEQGLAALQRKHYTEAIAHLKPLSHDRDRRIQTRSQIGLVHVYIAQGQRDEAIALCQILAQSPAAAVRQWAEGIQQRLQGAGKSPSSSATPIQNRAATPNATQKPATDFDDLAASLTYRKPPRSTPISTPPDDPPLAAVPAASPQAESVSPEITESAPETPTSTLPDEPPLVASSAEPPQAESGLAEAAEPALAASPTPVRPSLEEATIAQEATPSTDEATPSTDEGVEDDALEAEEASAEEASAEEASVEEAAETDGPPPLWKQAGRIDRGRSLGATDRAKLLVLEGVTVFLLIGMVWAIAQTSLSVYNAIVTRITLPFLNLSLFAVYVQLFWWVAGLVVLGLVIAPWFWRWQMHRGAQVQRLDANALETRSPETVQLLRRFIRKYGGTFKVQCLPEATPLIFSYGHGLNTRRIVLSQGLFDQLSDDEIATLVAAELTHFRFWDGAIVSGITALLQLPYELYVRAAKWGDRRNSPIFRIPAVIASVLGYGLFWTGRLATLWLSRMRLYYSDRAACELTGNPNGLTRALLKIAMGHAQTVIAQQETPYLLERLELLTPVGRQESLIIGSLYPSHPGSELLEWDRSNPYSRWLAVLDAQPPLGDRLHRLALIAQKWRLPQELEFSTIPTRPSNSWRRYLPVLIQASPLVGLIFGLLVGQGLWWLGIYAEQLRSISLDWLRNDFIHLACMAIGLGIGSLLRLNVFFPEIKRINTLPAGELPELLRPPNAMPVQQQTLRFQGTLIGRRGLANAIAQDLFLKTDEGLLRLHFLPFLSLSDNPIAGWQQLQRFLHETVLVSGWFRRGVTPWLDLNSLHTQNGRTMRSGHPLWAAAIGILAVLWGCYKILTGDI